jgi:hypothetical protein
MLKKELENRTNDKSLSMSLELELNFEILGGYMDGVEYKSINGMEHETLQAESKSKGGKSGILGKSGKATSTPTSNPTTKLTSAPTTESPSKLPTTSKPTVNPSESPTSTPSKGPTGSPSASKLPTS